MPMTKQIVSALAVFSAAMSAAGPGEGALAVEAGTPLYIRLEAKALVKAGQEVCGRLVHPVYVYDREVLAAGTVLSGSVMEVRPASRSERLRSYLSGRLRTRKEALVQFDRILLGDGRGIPVVTSATFGYPSLVRIASARTDPKPEPKTLAGRARQQARDAVANHEAVQTARALANRHTRGKVIPGILGALGDEARSYWPFGGQHLAAGSAFTPVLAGPLTLEAPAGGEDRALPRQPASNTLVRARIVTGVSSATAQAGSQVRAVTIEPVFSEDGSLLLPAGSAIRGEVTRAIAARRFGRNGKLQLRFTEFDPDAAADAPGFAVNGTLDAAEVSGSSGMKLDAEGAASIPVSKKRFLRPAIAGVLATSSVPDAESATKVHGGAPGWSGFGLAGTGIALAAPAVAGPLGWWGVASSTYYNLIRKANEVEFPANTVVEIRFGRPAAETGLALAKAAAGQQEAPPEE